MKFLEQLDGKYAAVTDDGETVEMNDLGILIEKYGPVLLGGNYYPWEEAQALIEDGRQVMEEEERYFETYTAFDGRTGMDYIKDKSLKHPFPTLFKHFHKTIGLEPEEAHLLACGENRFDLISDDFDNEKRVYASKFYDWLLEHDCWESSGEWKDGQILESPIIALLSESWSEDLTHPLYPLLQDKQDEGFDLPDLSEIFGLEL